MVEAADGPLHLPKMEAIASGRCAVQNMQVDGSACDGYRTASENIGSEADGVGDTWNMCR